ncbi:MULTISPECIES: Eco29kI family restriction endonuclease [unclassified Streptomyces]|uniref:Eco29kI family restriction endonuclease n=1 Tax=unclassified Streptomyces TaxID=2593676 RepID=UPI00386FC022
MEAPGCTPSTTGARPWSFICPSPLSSNSSTGEKVQEKYPLYSRLKQHRTSIAEGGLPIAEFRFRALLLPDVHADLGENGLRVGYQPLWNSKFQGFGSKEQGSTTRQSKKSK